MKRTQFTVPFALQTHVFFSFSDQVDKAVVTKERLSGTYRLSAYWLAKMTSELPIVLVVPFCTWTVTYLFVGLPLDIRIYLGTTVTVILAGFVGQVLVDCVLRFGERGDNQSCAPSRFESVRKGIGIPDRARA